jgi:hypothetical protein
LSLSVSSLAQGAQLCINAGQGPSGTQNLYFFLVMYDRHGNLVPNGKTGAFHNTHCLNIPKKAFTFSVGAQNDVVNSTSSPDQGSCQPYYMSQTDEDGGWGGAITPGMKNLTFHFRYITGTSNPYAYTIYCEPGA